MVVQSSPTVRQIIFCLCWAVVFVTSASAGSEAFPGKDKEMQQPAPLSPQWYADNEWNVTLWGTYVFTGTESNVVSPREIFFMAKGQTVITNGDRYIEADHAWGGGGEVKYFWHRYFGFGIESFALNAKRTQFGLGRTLLPGPGFIFGTTENHRVISSVMGTLTVRYPIGYSRF